ncbi:hypothetical protein GC194_03045 [bacterium]|nr:hypothetical protein [bacterium]
MKKNILLPLACIMLAAVLLGSFTYANKDKNKAPKPKNIVLITGTGMSLNQWEAARIANGGSLAIDNFTHIGLCSVESADQTVADAGAAATTVACGVKTLNGYAGLNAKGEMVKSLFYLAQDRKMKTAILTNGSVTGPVPAAFYANSKNLDDNYRTAYELSRANINLAIGGGYAFFANRPDGQDLITDLQKIGYSYYKDLKNPKKMGGEHDLVLVANNLLPNVESKDRKDFWEDALAIANYHLPLNVNGGYFMVMEGAQTDNAARLHDLNLMTKELLDFDKAIGLVLEQARLQGDILVVFAPLNDAGGLTIVDGKPAENKAIVKWTNDANNRTTMPVFAYGPGAENFSGYFSSTDIFKRISNLFPNE